MAHTDQTDVHSPAGWNANAAGDDESTGVCEGRNITRTCAFPGDQEHDHEMCHDAVVDAMGERGWPFPLDETLTPGGVGVAVNRDRPDESPPPQEHARDPFRQRSARP